MSTRKKEETQESENLKDLLSKTIKNTSNTFVLSIITRIVNLSCNIIIMRNITKNSFGIVKVYFEFAFQLMCSFPREVIRKTAQKFIPDSDKEKEKKKYDIILTLYSTVIMGMGIFAFFLFFAFLYFGGEKLTKNKTQLLIYIISGFFELGAEPIIIYMNLHLENKQLAITIGNFGRVISNMILAGGLHLDMWSFTLSRVIGSGLYSSYLYSLGIFKYKINLGKLFLPNLKALIFNDKIDGIELAPAKDILFSFIKVTSLKMILQHGEKTILSFVLHQSDEEKGEYSFVIENFSFFTRFLLEPINDTFYNLINKVKNYKSKNTTTNNKNLLNTILKIFIKILLIFGTILISYYFLAGREFVEYVYSSKWSTPSTERIGRFQAIYIAIFSINGIIEAYANATNNTQQMNSYNFLMIINSVLLVLFMTVLSRIDISGLIIANSLCMLIRIFGNLYIIFNGNDKEKEKNSIFNIGYFIKELYLSFMSIIFTVFCVVLGFFVRGFFNYQKLGISLFCYGVLITFNIFAIYLFEKDKIKFEYGKIKDE